MLVVVFTQALPRGLLRVQYRTLLVVLHMDVDHIVIMWVAQRELLEFRNSIAGSR